MNQTKPKPNVHSRIRFKLATITYEDLCTNSPQYLASHIRYHQSVRSLRSSDQHFLVPTPSSTNVGSRSFRSAAPVIFNSLPLSIRTSATIDTFKRSLKTHYSASLLSRSSSPRASDSFMTFCTLIYIYIYIYITIYHLTYYVACMQYRPIVFAGI